MRLFDLVSVSRAAAIKVFGAKFKIYSTALSDWSMCKGQSSLCMTSLSVDTGRTSTMANAGTRQPLSVGKFVFYDGHCGYITSIDNALGFNRYNVLDLDSGITVQKYHYQLQPMKEDPLPVSVADDILFQLNPAPVVEEIKEKDDKKRFASVTADELDTIEANRNSSRTKRQTSWAVGIFKGESVAGPFKL